LHEDVATRLIYSSGNGAVAVGAVDRFGEMIRYTRDAASR
jgi:hypothetical protein